MVLVANQRICCLGLDRAHVTRVLFAQITRARPDGRRLTRMSRVLVDSLVTGARLVQQVALLQHRLRRLDIIAVDGFTRIGLMVGQEIIVMSRSGWIVGPAYHGHGAVPDVAIVQLIAPARHRYLLLWVASGHRNGRETVLHISVVSSLMSGRR